jgi:hypothetical protein
MDEIVFRINKLKSISLTLVAIGLFVVLIWFFIDVITLPSAFNRTFLLICCSFLIVSMLGSSIIGVKNLLNSKQGIIIDKGGIKINIGQNKGLFISWGEITELKTRSTYGGPMFLLIFIENPDRVLSEIHGLRKFLLKMNNISHKTPVSLTSTWINCSFEVLVESVTEGLKIYGVCR